MRTLIKNAWILTMNEKMQEYKDGQIVIEDDKILYVGKPKEFDSIDNIVDAKNCLVLPGMVNTHCHVSMLPFRSLQDDCPDRLRRFLFPLENACMNEDFSLFMGLVMVQEKCFYQELQHLLTCIILWIK